RYQAKVMKYPLNEIFIYLQLFITIQLIFLVLGNNELLKLGRIYRDPFKRNYKCLTINIVNRKKL
ncbi:hypothetical protein COF01_28325, partial [Bacillus pseudomycoides]